MQRIPINLDADLDLMQFVILLTILKIFHPELQVDLETVNIEDLGNTRHTVVASEMVDMVKKITTELVAKKDNCSF